MKETARDQGVYSLDDLASRECVSCGGDVPRLEGAALERFAAGLEGWRVVDAHHLTRHYDFKDFAASLAFVNSIGEIAEREGHHPDIAFGWGYADIKILTHAIDGLSESDFILAAKIERLGRELQHG